MNTFSSIYLKNVHQMSDVDPETLLEWLSMGQGDEREMQLIALEQLCMLLLMSDNVDRCFESCPPRTFLPALCKIFLDELAPENVSFNIFTIVWIYLFIIFQPKTIDTRSYG